MKTKASSSARRKKGDWVGDPKARISAVAASLSPQQKLIADYVLDHMKDVPFLAVPDLAERIGASEATIVRFCQRIGYSGYSDLKMALVDSLREDMQASQSRYANPDVSEIGQDSLIAMAKLEQHNIERTLDSIDRRDFRSAASNLFKADYVHCFGFGISACLAQFASYLLTEHGMRSTAMPTHFSSPNEQLVALTKKDTVLAFSFPPYSRQTLDLLEELKHRDIPSVVITDRASSPAAALAGQALVVSSHGMTFTNATASTMVLLNALVVEISSRHRDETVDAISRINDILRDQTYVVDET